MKYLHFVQAVDAKRGGGLGLAARDLSEWTARLGQSSVLLSTGECAQKDESTVIVKRSGPPKLFYSAELVNLAAELISNAEQVHGHGFYTYLNWVVGKEVRQKRKALCYHIHGFLDPYILRRSRVKKALVKLLFEDANFRHVRLWRALTRKEAEQALQYGIRSRIEILPNGVDLDKLELFKSSFETNKHDPFNAGGRNVLLFLGRLHEKKGIDLLIKAFANARAPKKGWVLAIVGPDENGQLDVLQRLATEAGVEADVCFYPAVHGDAKYEVLSSATAFALASRSEGMPLAVLEAAAFRLPLLISTECNLPEFDSSAFCVSPEVGSVTRGLRQLINASEDELRERSQFAYEIVSSTFNWPNIAKKWLSICGDL